MDALLYFHHLPLHESTTRKHLALLRSLNPDAEVVPLCFDNGRGTPEWQWKNFDMLAFEWFERENPKHERIFFFEYDCLCMQSVKEFYGPAYHRPAVASIVVKPWSYEIIPGSYGEPIMMKNWHWFTQCESGDLYPYLRGMVPVCGSMFRHDVFFSMNQLLKANGPAFEPLLSEARLGTLACMAGHEPERIRPDCHKFLHSGDVDITQGPGCYHRVRI